MKIIFTDKNKKLCKKVEDVFQNVLNNTHCKLIVRNEDVLKVKKEFSDAKIITASNPNFSAEGGLDAVLKKKYPDQWTEPREFKFEKDLFFVISVGEDTKAKQYWVRRAFFGAYMCSRKHDIIITGIGTGIGGFSEDDFIYELYRFVEADFRSSDFSCSDFKHSDFSYSDFSGSNFRRSDFTHSDFSDSNFRHSDFNNSDFSRSNFNNSNFNNSDFGYSDFSNSNFNNSDFNNLNFRHSDFRHSDFSNSNFNNSNFRHSNFRHSNFRHSNFRHSDFSYSSFKYSNFRYSDFNDSEFRHSDFSYSDFKFSHFTPSNFSNSKFDFRIYPETGKFIGWKKAGGKILKLEIQDANKVSGGFINRKLRTDKVKVLEIQEIDGKKSKERSVKSNYSKDFVYKVGKMISEPNFVKDNKIDCAEGIHFFMTRDEVVNW